MKSDLELMKRLAAMEPDHRKMIVDVADEMWRMAAPAITRATAEVSKRMVARKARKTKVDRSAAMRQAWKTRKANKAAAAAETNSMAESVAATSETTE